MNRFHRFRRIKSAQIGEICGFVVLGCAWRLPQALCVSAVRIYAKQSQFPLARTDAGRLGREMQSQVPNRVRDKNVPGRSRRKHGQTTHSTSLRAWFGRATRLNCRVSVLQPATGTRMFLLYSSRAGGYTWGFQRHFYVHGLELTNYEK